MSTQLAARDSTRDCATFVDGGLAIHPVVRGSAFVLSDVPKSDNFWAEHLPALLSLGSLYDDGLIAQPGIGMQSGLGKSTSYNFGGQFAMIPQKAPVYPFEFHWFRTSRNLGEYRNDKKKKLMGFCTQEARADET